MKYLNHQIQQVQIPEETFVPNLEVMTNETNFISFL